MPETTTRQPIVWLANEGGHDYRTAEKFGRIMPITTGSINPFSPDRLMVLISHRLQVASADDFLVISGSPLLNALIVAMWLRRFDHLNLLLWSHRDSEYKLVTVQAATVDRLATEEGRIAP